MDKMIEQGKNLIKLIKSVLKDEKVYSKPNTLKHVYEFEEDLVLKPLFFF